MYQKAIRTIYSCLKWKSNEILFLCFWNMIMCSTDTSSFSKPISRQIIRLIDTK